MDNNQGMIGMALRSWRVAIAGGALAAVVLWVLGGWSFMQGAFVGIIVFLLLAVLISWFMTRPLPTPDTPTIDVPTPVAPTPVAPTPAATAPSRVADVPAATTDARPATEAAKPKAKAPATEAAKPKAKAPTGADATPKPKAAAASDARPSGFNDAPRAGGADNLKLIGGVGPKLEETLNSLGIWHFDQVAGLNSADIAWVDARLRFKGRIERDDWVGQAKVLAEGGETAFSKKKRKG